MTIRPRPAPAGAGHGNARQGAQDAPRRIRAPRKARIPVPLERDVQKAAVAVLEALGCVVHRRNTGTSGPLFYKGRRRYIRYSEPGASDLWAITPTGVHWEVEIKRPGERPTSAQVAWLMAHNEVGSAAAFWGDDAAALERVARAILGGARVVYLNERGDYDLAAPGPRPARPQAPQAEDDPCP